MQAKESKTAPKQTLQTKEIIKMKSKRGKTK
jgi:hypothetical protein